MESYLVNDSNGLSVVNENFKALSCLCTELTEAFNGRKLIRDKTMLDFSRLTCQLIYGGLSEKLPREFADLSDVAEDYWLYHAHKEKDKNLCFSYIRIYQITSMVRVFDKDKLRDRFLFEATEKHKKNFDLLKNIYMDPGINHKVLSEKLGITTSKLSHKIDKLEESGFLFVRHMGKNKCYSLSNLGLNLYKRLCDQNIEEFKHLAWGAKRLQIIAAFLMILADYYPKYYPYSGYNRDEVIALEKYLDKWSDDDLVEMLRNYFMKDSNISAVEVVIAKRIEPMRITSGSNPQILDILSDVNDVLTYM